MAEKETLYTILDYTRWRGDLTFAEKGFNRVDNLIFSELAYFEFDDILTPADEGKSITIKEAFDRYKKQKIARVYGVNKPVPLMKACAATRRFGDLRVYNYEEITDTAREIQFAAMTFETDAGDIYVAFRGTDNTLVGWREDFNSSFMRETPAQAEAVKYLRWALDAFPGRTLRVGGHSKGGNMAIYAAAFCRQGDEPRVTEVYSNDGPGFNNDIVVDPDYQQVLPKVQLIIPEDSFISLLFFNKEEKEIVRSTVTGGVQQHDPYTWCVERDHFLDADKQKSSSVLLDQTLDKWISALGKEDKERFVTTVFGVLEASGAQTLGELNSNKWLSYNAILKAAVGQTSEAKNTFKDTIVKLALTHRDVVWDETKKRFEPDPKKQSKKLLPKRNKT